MSDACKTVFIAEKPSVARDIAAMLGVVRRQSNYLVCKGDVAVTWAFGHMLEQVDPEEYNAEWGGRWRFEHLPMIPSQWRLKPVGDKGRRAQLKAITALVKKAKTVVIATDAGREGELIGREVVEHARFKGELKRFWQSAMTESGLRKALASLLPGADKDALHAAAASRQHADWLHGLNLTRAATLAFNRPKTLMPVGRVQTPTLALVVQRCETIENFTPQTYYELQARVKTASGHELELMHSPPVEQRISKREQAQALIERCQGAEGVLRVESKAGRQSPALPFSIGALQKAASKAFGWTASKTLEMTQSLYEGKSVTYPRTDYRHLSASQKDEVPATLAAIRKHMPEQVEALERMGVELRKSTFDDSKIGDHHGIVPTDEYHSLSGDQAKLYKLIATQYMRAIAPDRLFTRTTVSMDADGILFTAAGKVITQQGWGEIR